MFARAGRLIKRVWATRWVPAAVISALVSVLATSLVLERQPKPLRITQDDITAALVKAIETEPLPSRTALAAEKIRPAVVRVRGFDDDSADAAAPDKPTGKPPAPGIAPAKPRKPATADRPAQDRKREQAKRPELPRPPGGGDKPGEADKDQERSVGSGVLISDAGIILTNLHVVAGAKRLKVTFFDGFESEAIVVGLRPENDLAIIKAKRLPDDIEPATLGGSGGLKPGDEVVAVGFPFGMGPSVSAGVVSGLNREFRSPDGERALSGLIQFDAAANPGNSGGPLVNMAGEVVGIVTAIFNPSGGRTFIGIGFAVTMEAAGNAVGIPPL